jgi:cysteine desulfurase
MTEPIYLDHQATTPVDSRVLDKMLPYFGEVYGNPSSIDHVHGHKAKLAVDDAREQIAKNLGCRKASEIIFTSGATEANNLALIGAYRRLKEKGRHIVASSIEHPAVLDTLKYLQSEGAQVTLLPVDNYGVVDLDALKKSIKNETILVSVMYANNEIGTIQPIKEIGEIVKAHSVLFHVDAAQAVGHEAIHVYDMNIDLMSFSAHKFYGPKGIGGLFVRSFSPMVRLVPLSFGGGHERGLRPGTINVPGVVGMAEALSIAVKEQFAENKRISIVAKDIIGLLIDHCHQLKINGHPECKLAHNISLTLPGIEAKALIHLLKDKMSFSAGSACSTVKVEPSHVLKAIGLTDDECFQTIRLGLGRSNDDAKTIAQILNTAISDLNNKMNTRGR